MKSLTRLYIIFSKTVDSMFNKDTGLWLLNWKGSFQSPTQNLCHRLIIIHEMCDLHIYQATSNMDANRNILFILG